MQFAQLRNRGNLRIESEQRIFILEANVVVVNYLRQAAKLEVQYDFGAQVCDIPDANTENARQGFLIFLAIEFDILIGNEIGDRDSFFPGFVNYELENLILGEFRCLNFIEVFQRCSLFLDKGF